MPVSTGAVPCFAISICSCTPLLSLFPKLILASIDSNDQLIMMPLSALSVFVYTNTQSHCMLVAVLVRCVLGNSKSTCTIATHYESRFYAERSSKRRHHMLVLCERTPLRQIDSPSQFNRRNQQVASYLAAVNALAWHHCHSAVPARSPCQPAQQHPTCICAS